MRGFLFASLFLLSAGLVQAAEAPLPDAGEKGRVPSAQPAPSSGSGVTITPGEDGMIEEYRHNGRLYMIKVIPRKGASYYLVDSNGDGNLDTHHSGLESDVLVPRWTILRWK